MVMNMSYNLLLATAKSSNAILALGMDFENSFLDFSHPSRSFTNYGVSFETSPVINGSYSIYNPPEPNGGDTHFLSTADAPELRLTGDFTLDFWIYPLSTSSSNYVFNTRLNTGNDYGFDIWGNGEVTTSNVVHGIVTLTANTWQHFAIIRYNGTTKGYINGNSIVTLTAFSETLSSTSYQIGGSTHANVGYFQGYIDELCVTPGYARWTSNFTTPTQPYLV